MYGNNYFMPYTMPIGAFNRTLPIAKTGFLGKLGGATSAIRGINWGGLLNNASRTLGVINQAIPVVKQAGPMLNNMKSMIRLASAFKNETSPSKINNKSNNNLNNIDNNVNSTSVITKEKKEIVSPEDYLPNFFIN